TFLGRDRRVAVGPRDAAGVYPPLPGGPGDSGRGVAGPYGRGLLCPVFRRRGGLPHPLRQTKGETIMSIAAGFIFLIPILILVLAAITAVGVFVYRDAKARGLPAAAWTLCAVLLPGFVG